MSRSAATFALPTLLVLFAPALVAQSAARSAERPAPRYRTQGQYRGSGQAQQTAFSESRGGFVDFNRIRQPGSLFPHRFTFQGGTPAPVNPPFVVPRHFVGFGGFSNLLLVPNDGFEAPAPPPQPTAPQPIVIVVQQPAAPPPPVPAAAPPPRPAAPPPPDLPRDPGKILFSIRPPDATVYLDDRRIGTAAELNARREALPARAGVHILEVVHPDLDRGRLFFGVEPHATVSVQVDLTTTDTRHRARLETDSDLFATP